MRCDRKLNKSLLILFVDEHGIGLLIINLHMRVDETLSKFLKREAQHHQKQLQHYATLFTLKVQDHSFGVVFSFAACRRNRNTMFHQQFELTFKNAIRTFTFYFINPYDILAICRIQQNLVGT